MYLVAVMDRWSRYVLAWELSNGLDSEFCIRAWTGALASGRPPLISTTDPGSQFTSEAYLDAVESAGAANPAELNSEQRQELQAWVAAADGISQALAEDNLEDFKKHQIRMIDALALLEKELGPTHALGQLVQRLTKTLKLPPAKDLVEARRQFLPVSMAAVELARQLRGQDGAFARLKVYHCPMAPKPGLWLQAKGPLANPFFGAEMLRCGEEVKAEADLALRQSATSK
jgi:hypothetical protein